MATDPHKRTFSSADIEGYHRGTLSAKERHALEKAALDDPFLSDALEGFGGSAASIKDDLADLQQRLGNRIGEKAETPVVPMAGNRRSGIAVWLKVAAVIVFVAVTALLVYRFNEPQTTKTITLVPAPEENRESPATAVQPPAEDRAVGKVDAPTAAAKNPPPRQFTLSPANHRDQKDALVPGVSKREEESELKSEEPELVARESEARSEPAVTAQPEAQDGYNFSPKAKKATNSALQSNGLTAKNFFRGRVTDAQNNALPFSNIVNLDDNVGTYSDSKGYFNLTSPDSVLNVRVRSVGFESNVVQLRNTRTDNNIMLQEDRSMAANVLDTTKRIINRSRTSNMVLEEPEPVDGWTNYDTYITNNLKAPELRNAKPYSGDVELSFEVDKNGDPINITVTKSLCESCDREAIRLLKEGPKWKRKQKNKKVRISVNF